MQQLDTLLEGPGVKVQLATIVGSFDELFEALPFGLLYVDTCIVSLGKITSERSVRKV